MAAKSFSVFYTGCSQACVFSVCGAIEMEGLSMAAAAGRTVALITQVLQVLGGKRGAFLCLDQRAQRDCMLKQSRKLIGYTYLVCLCLFGPLFSLPSIEGRAFTLSLISTVEHHGGGE